jgi:hypothetical protein
MGRLTAIASRSYLKPAEHPRMPDRPMTATQLRYANYTMLSIVSVAGAFLLWDVYLSIAKDVPRLGVFGYVTGPMFAHKLSEIVIAGAWLWFALMYNHEKAKLWPAWMTTARYHRSLHLTAIVVLCATVLATYSWTILNLGTSARTTNLAEPPGIGEEGFVWRYYLAGVIIAGVAYVMFAMRKLAQYRPAP